MTEESDSLFPFAGPPPAGMAPAAGESLPPPPWWAAPVPLAREVAAIMTYLTKRRAMDLLAAERFAEARAAFDGLLASAPTDVNWLFLKGVCCVQMEDYRAALASLTEAERREPFDPELLLVKAVALLGLREYDQAEHLLTHLLACDPDNSSARYRFACWAALTDQPHRALNELRRLFEAESGFREEAAADPAFAGLRRLPAFRKLIAAPPRQE